MGSVDLQLRLVAGPKDGPNVRATTQMTVPAIPGRGATPVSGSPVARPAPAPNQPTARPTPRPSSPPVAPPPGAATAVLPAGAAFAKPDPRSQTGRRKGDSHQPLEFAQNQQIGRFELIRELARGGMGQVFLARDIKLGRKVAIKFLLQNDPNFVRRFLVEARATARCTHENIVTIFEVGEHEGLPFMVLEYLEGKTLTQILESKPTIRQFIELIIPVVRALERAHSHGIVHRDLKPSNIFVTDQGQVKVLDFGVARVVGAADDARERVTHAMPAVNEIEIGGENTYVTFSSGGSLVGTLPYMSPEQWGADEVDHLSDLWAVGIMFWRALAGVHPAGTMDPIKLKERLCDVDTPLPSIASREPNLPRDLAAVVDRCLAKHKSQRTQSASALLAQLQAVIAPKTERLSEDACPYRGLASFGEGDAKFFFGRSAEIRTALGQLDQWPLLAVVGPSGVGKSSFVHAGLVPTLRATGGNWQVRVLRPGRAPLQRLAGVLDEAIETGEVHGAVVEQLHESPGLFGRMLRMEAAKRRHKVLIVVDQLEELFTLSSDTVDRQTFLAALLAAADDPSAPVRVVLSMRADFLDRLAHHKQFLSELSRGLFFLSAPDRENLMETLVRPAELAGYAFEDPWIVEDMMQVATSKGALPLLQFAATRLWDARDRNRKLLTISAYNHMGGVGGAFARHADEIAAGVPPQSLAILRAIMTRLVTPEGTRAIIDHGELLSLSTDRAEVERILDQLVSARLIQLHNEPGTPATVEIVHEMLITEWPTLQRWLEDSHAVRGFVHELQAAARQWASRGRRADLVWRGATAQDALATAKRHVLDLSTVEKDFLAAVRKQVSRSRRGKVIVFATIFSVLGLVIAGGAVAVVRITAAEHDAQAKAVEIQHQLDFVKAAQKTKEDAERRAAEAAKQSEEAAKQQAEAQKRQAEAAAQQAEAEKETQVANAKVQLSAEELQRANSDLKHALSESQRAQKAAQEQADIAKRATDSANAATAKLQVMLKTEQERVKQLEQEKQKIYSGGLH